MGVLRVGSPLGATCGILLALFLTGCGSSGPEGPTGTVRGTVSYKGKPVTEGLVQFFSGNGIGQGTISSDGTYILGWPGGLAVPVGEYRVSINPPRLPDNDDDPGAAAPVNKDKRFPKKYRVVVTSGLTCKVTEGGNTHDFDMK